MARRYRTVIIYLICSINNKNNLFANILIYIENTKQKKAKHVNSGKLRSENTEDWGTLILLLILSKTFLTICIYLINFLKM